MSTRGLIGFRFEEKEYLTYNHSDSYPTGLGRKACNFIAIHLSSPSGLETIRSFVKCLRLVDEAAKPTQEQIEACMRVETVNLDVGNRSYDSWYCLLREAQGDLIKNLAVGYMIDSHDFILDSLFCEWAYIIDLDTCMLEVYKGFMKKPVAGNRYGDKPDEDGYYPCCLAREPIPFSEAVPELMNDIEEETNLED